MSWGTTTIGKVCDVVPGFAFKSKDLVDTGIPVIKIGNITDSYSVDIESSQCFPENKMTDKHGKFILKDGDIIIAMTGATAGKVGRIRAARDRVMLLNQRVAVLRPFNINPKYFWAAISNERYRTIFYALGGGAAQPNMSGAQIEAVAIPFPPDTVQDRIADVLSSYDDLIENNRRRIELLDGAARQLYKEWFVRFRFPGHEHVNILDGVPEGWESKTLGDIADTNTQSYSKKNLPDNIQYIDISSVSRGHILNKTSLSYSEAPGRARRVAKHGDIIWSNVRPNLRAHSLVLDPEKNDVFSTGFTILSARSVPFTFLYQLTTTDNFVSHLVNHATGASYPAVRPADFERAEIVVPYTVLLEQYHDIVEPHYRLISLLDKESRALAQARDLLLPRLMSGEIAA